MKLLPFNLEEALKNPERVVRVLFPNSTMKEITRHGDIAIITWDIKNSTIPEIYTPRDFEKYLRLKPVVDKFYFNVYKSHGATMQTGEAYPTLEAVPRGMLLAYAIYCITDDGETATIERIAV